MSFTHTLGEVTSVPSREEMEEGRESDSSQSGSLLSSFSTECPSYTQDLRHTHSQHTHTYVRRDTRTHTTPPLIFSEVNLTVTSVFSLFRRQ